MAWLASAPQRRPQEGNTSLAEGVEGDLFHLVKVEEKSGGADLGLVEFLELLWTGYRRQSAVVKPPQLTGHDVREQGWSSGGG